MYDRVFLSHHTKDLDVFTRITDSPHLSPYVTEMVVDTSCFDRYNSPFSYSYALLKELQDVLLVRYDEDYKFDVADQQINDLLAYAHRYADTDRYSKRCHEMNDYRIVRRGQAWYSKFEKEQEKNIKNGELNTRLALGLKALSRLHTVRFENEWGKHANGVLGWVPRGPTLKPWRMRSSPLARSWHPLYLPPKPFKLNMFPEFCTVMHGLALTGKSLQKLSTFRLPPTIFTPCDLQLSHRRLEDMLQPLRALEDFRLNITRLPSSSTPLASGLATVLHSLTKLKQLNVNLDDGGFNDDSSCYPFSDLFGSTIPSYPNLSYLGLEAIECSSSHLISFLRSQPSLIILRIRKIELTEGEWAPTFDQLRDLKLSFFCLDGPLKEMGGVNVWDDEFPLIDDLENYVMGSDKENPLPRDD